jgi:hypothetical protein
MGRSRADPPSTCPCTYQSSALSVVLLAAAAGMEKVLRIFDLEKPDADPLKFPAAQSGIRSVNFIQVLRLSWASVRSERAFRLRRLLAWHSPTDSSTMDVSRLCRAERQHAARVICGQARHRVRWVLRPADMLPRRAIGDKRSLCPGGGRVGAPWHVVTDLVPWLWMPRIYDVRTLQQVTAIETTAPVTSVEVRPSARGRHQMWGSVAILHVVWRTGLTRRATVPEARWLRFFGCSYARCNSTVFRSPYMASPLAHAHASQVSFDQQHVTTAEGSLVRFFDAGSMQLRKLHKVSAAAESARCAAQPDAMGIRCR